MTIAGFAGGNVLTSVVNNLSGGAQLVQTYLITPAVQTVVDTPQGVEYAATTELGSAPGSEQLVSLTTVDTSSLALTAPHGVQYTPSTELSSQPGTEQVLNLSTVDTSPLSLDLDIGTVSQQQWSVDEFINHAVSCDETSDKCALMQAKDNKDEVKSTVTMETNPSIQPNPNTQQDFSLVSLATTPVKTELDLPTTHFDFITSSTEASGLNIYDEVHQSITNK